MYKASKEVTTTKVLKVASLFPNMVIRDMCSDYNQQISKEEILNILGAFEKDRNPRLDG